MYIEYVRLSRNLYIPYVRLSTSFKIMPAGTACAIIKVAHMQIFRTISQYLTDCTTLLLSHWEIQWGKRRKFKSSPKNIYQLSKPTLKLNLTFKMATFGGGRFSGFFFIWPPEMPFLIPQKCQFRSNI